MLTYSFLKTIKPFCQTDFLVPIDVFRSTEQRKSRTEIREGDKQALNIGFQCALTPMHLQMIRLTYGIESDPVCRYDVQCY